MRDRAEARSPLRISHLPIASATRLTDRLLRSDFIERKFDVDYLLRSSGLPGSAIAAKHLCRTYVY